jgi:uncharacterized repeat protein (TIGR01451 family)
MDYTITPAPRRSLVRRLAPWVASLGMFAGGGYVVYRYAAPGESTAAAAEATPAETPTDRLLAAMPSQGAAKSPYTTPFDPPADRYAAPMLPAATTGSDVERDEVTTPRDAAAVQAPINPFAAAPLANYRDQAAAAPMPTNPVATQVTPVSHTAPVTETATVSTEAPAAETISEVTAEADALELARGQEPESTNPLRSGSTSTASSSAIDATDARAAFGNSSTSTAPLTMPPATSAARGSSDITVAGSRYGSPGAVSAPAPAPTIAPMGLAATSPAPTTPTATSSTPAANTPATSPYGASPYAAVQPSYLATRTIPDTETSTSPTLPSYAQPPDVAAGGVTHTPGFESAAGTGRPGERILEGVQTPALTLQKLAPPEIQVGKKAMFQIRVQNNSQRAAHNVVITDEVPLGTQLVGTAPKAAVTGAQIAWDLGTLSVGEERIVEMELLPTEEGELGSIATVTFAAQASAKARSTRPQLALRLSANPRVMIGEQQIVQIEVSNPGTGDATGVMLLESIPEGVSHEAGPALEFEIGTLAAGQTKQIPLLLQAEKAGIVDNLMTAKADANLQVQANCQFEVIAPALEVKVEGPKNRILERPATYTVSVDNPGTATAREVQLVTQLPKGLQFVSANNLGEYDATTHSVYWSLAELPANGSGAVELTALAVEPGDHTLQVATRAQQGLEDRAEARLVVEGIVALGFEVQDVEDAIEVGGETTYDVRVVNQGTKAATNVQIVAVMPPGGGLRAQPGQGDSRYTIQGDRVVFAPLAQLAPKAEAKFQFRVQGLRAGDQRVTLQVVTDEVRDPIVEVESTQVYADE